MVFDYAIAPLVDPAGSQEQQPWSLFSTTTTRACVKLVAIAMLGVLCPMDLNYHIFGALPA